MNKPVAPKVRGVVSPSLPGTRTNTHNHATPTHPNQISFPWPPAPNGNPNAQANQPSHWPGSSGQKLSNSISPQLSTLGYLVCPGSFGPHSVAPHLVRVDSDPMSIPHCSTCNTTLDIDRQQFGLSLVDEEKGKKFLMDLSKVIYGAKEQPEINENKSCKCPMSIIMRSGCKCGGK